GHDGSLATVHANSAEDALMRLQTLGSMAEVQIPFEALRDQINSAVDVVVQLSRAADGSRRLAEIAVLVSHGREPFRIATVSRHHPGPPGPDRAAPGWFEHLPLPRPVADRLHLAGEGVPPAFGVTDTADPAHVREALA
ncbi:ATPase, T2SS/T4P/T4SS family, partial [Streptomyces sp. CAI-78]|nr:Flp pilus assembly complex ATPase component TadA [Streptomyces sp. CAI-78]